VTPSRPFRAAALIGATLLLSPQAALAQFKQEGQKLVGAGAIGGANQGYSVALSADGDTAIVGGPLDHDNRGAAWVFTRSGGVWTQQGKKLVGTPSVGFFDAGALQGWSVALSANGDTAIVGGPDDDLQPPGHFTGAAWVFTRSGGVWTQQSKLVGTTTANGPAQLGFSVALSADGDTAIVGGLDDNLGPSGYNVGVAWVFTRSRGVWTQQSIKLVGAGAVAQPLLSASVALSADGDTAILGGPSANIDSSGLSVGATWVLTRSGVVWTQQGGKLVGTRAVGPAEQGAAVALSADGDTVIAGGPTDNLGPSGYGDGATWVFTRSGAAWTQQGKKLVGTGAAGNAEQGYSVALSADGDTAVAGGPHDNADAGAAWVFTRSGDVWTQLGGKLVGTDPSGNAEQGYSVALSANGDTAIVGGPHDNGDAGAAWVFVRPSAASP
jgi:hypothetical protein